MRTYDYIENFVDFDDDISEKELYKPKHLINLHVSLQGDMTAASAVDELTLLSAINPLEIKVAAVPRIRLTGPELWAFNVLFLGHEPVIQRAGAATDDKTRVLDLIVPLNYPTGAPTITYSVTHSAVSGVDTKKLTVVAEYSDEEPKEAPLQLLKFSYTPASSGAFLRALERTLAGDLEGIIFYSTTVPTDSSNTSTVSEIELYVGGDLVTRTREWHIYKPVGYVYNNDGTPTAGLLNNYLFLDLRKEPIPKGNRIAIDINAGDTNSISIIPIERLTS